MAWTIAVIIGILSLAVITFLLSNSFTKERKSMKVLMIMITLGILIILSQSINLIIQNKATGDNLIALSSLAFSTLIITISLFSFFILFFFIMYMKNILKTMKNAKEKKVTEIWGEL